MAASRLKTTAKLTFDRVTRHVAALLDIVKEAHIRCKRWTGERVPTRNIERGCRSEQISPGNGVENRISRRHRIDDVTKSMPLEDQHGRGVEAIEVLCKTRRDPFFVGAAERPRPPFRRNAVMSGVARVVAILHRGVLRQSALN